MICQRCRKETDGYTMSRFNTELICMDCFDKEQKHLKYAEAAERELQECKRGNSNFKGIGKPADL